MNNLVTSASDS